MKKYGIYLGYAPEQEIRNQGLGRLLAFIIKGFIEKKMDFVICYPQWYEKNINDLCEEHDIDMKHFEKISTSGTPMLIIIKKILDKFLKKKKSGTGLLGRLKKSALSAVGKAGIRWLSLSSVPMFVAVGAFYTALFLLLLPLIFALGVAGAGLVIAVKLLNMFGLRAVRQQIAKPIKSFKSNILARRIFDIIREDELTKLNSLINKRKDIEVMMIPALFWPEINSLKAKKVVVAPDIIFYDFPAQYNSPVMNHINDQIMSTISAADHFITYSNYVKENHLVKPFKIAPERISVVPHGATSMSSYLEKEDSLQIIKDYQRKKLSDDPYLCNFDFEDTKYIFYSSQIRPHKNFMNLIKAYEFLLREKYINIKLVTTANLIGTSVNEYIIKKGLQNDVMSIFNVPSKVLAALNARATCIVTPTMFEGGFPFTFLEGYTVGTPSVMSDIPMTSELISSESLRERMLFDPTSVEDMAEKIEYGVLHSEALFEEQRELYEEMSRRTWADAAYDYIKVLENVK